MAKMKSLMPDDEAPSTGQAEVEAGAPAEARPAVPVPAPPDWLEGLARPYEAPLVLGGNRAPYVGFANRRSASFEALLQLHKTIKEGTPFVAHSDGQLELADPLKFHLVRDWQFWSQRDDQYNLKRVVFRDPGRHSGFKEEFLALALVHLGGRLVPTVSYFGGTKAGAIRPAAAALRVAGTPEWVGRSPAHAASAQCRLLCGRFVTEVTLEPGIGRDTGHPYQAAVGHVRPSNLEELALLARALDDPQFLDQLHNAIDVFETRLRHLEERARAPVA